MMGVRTLDAATVQVIENNILELKKQKELSNPDKPFMHQCPFLVNKRCSLYNFRGIICRSHGLAFFSKEGKLLVPACVDLGLNYSSVYDFETQTISDEKYKQSGIKQEPLAHNVGIHYLTNNDYLQSIGLIKGGSLENAVVLDGDKILNPGGFRISNECVNHKVIDAIGDMYTAGCQILGSLKASKSGHYHNNEVLKKLFSSPTNYEII